MATSNSDSRILVHVVWVMQHENNVDLPTVSCQQSKYKIIQLNCSAENSGILLRRVPDVCA